MKRLLYGLERLAFVITLVPGIPFALLWLGIGLLLVAPILFIFGNIGIEDTMEWLLNHEPHFLWADSMGDRH